MRHEVPSRRVRTCRRTRLLFLCLHVFMVGTPNKPVRPDEASLMRHEVPSRRALSREVPPYETRRVGARLFDFYLVEQLQGSLVI